MPRTKKERAAKMAQIKKNHQEIIEDKKYEMIGQLEEVFDNIAGIISRIESMETFLEKSGYQIEAPELLKDLETNANLHGHLIGEFDLDQVRQDAHRQNDRKIIKKNGNNIKHLKKTQDRILKKVNE